MIMATVVGTLSSIPVIPHNVPQIASASMATNGLMLSVLPISFGSTRLPINITAVPTPKNITSDGTNSTNWSRTKNVGNKVPMIGPTDGMKLNRKIKKAQNIGVSIPTAERIIKLIPADNRFTKDFKLIYLDIELSTF